MDGGAEPPDEAFVPISDEEEPDSDAEVQLNTELRDVAAETAELAELAMLDQFDVHELPRQNQVGAPDEDGLILSENPLNTVKDPIAVLFEDDDDD